MRLVAVRERTVTIGGALGNAAGGFHDMTASALVVVSDRRRGGRPLTGLAFDSIGRYAHGALLRERFIPRLLAAPADAYRDASGASIDPVRVWPLLMADEKPGGHGERAGAVGLLDAALWDLAAKTMELPLWRLLAERFGGGADLDDDDDGRVAVYASGGHYPGVSAAEEHERLVRAIRRGRERGHTRFKIKIGGASPDRDRRRIEAALGAAGGAALAVDANGVWDEATARAYLDMLRDYPLAWIEEPADPLDYALYRALAEDYPGALASGENLFSAADLQNLLRYAGLRSQRDYLQMDISLSYGIREYLRMLDLLAAAGWSRQRCWPHAGHLFALHAVAGLGLGGHETALDPELAFAGFAEDCVLEDGELRLGETPGAGIERLPALYRQFRGLV